ncbi:MAG TPA: alkaline phosphatase family protein [Spirochaetota bacterium]|nr:alkaline phosphatase family protein [Spirochaetota bacterium]
MYTPNISQRIVPVSCKAGNIFNKGATRTVPGHTALSTGFYEDLANDGSEVPSNPSFMHLFVQLHPDSDKVWLVTSKNKLSVLASVRSGPFTPVKYSCGYQGTTRDDALTFAEAKRIMDAYAPDVMFISFMEPDVSGHSGIWSDYLAAITRTDALIGKLFDYINADPDYAGRTDLIIANDHGRHSDGVNGGFSGHGCTCEGCEHIMCVAYGPDFKKGYASDNEYQQVDIPATSAYLLGLSIPGSEGKVIREFLLRE